MSRSSIPCAIYTRKSSEEGLEQGFNSLDAQREACAAFILSQKAEGWNALPEAYDDGGYSGGTLERPALLRLMDDIEQKRIRVVVVYKVDRLTRSLTDFARIVERFDALGVSFVSVTQQFNTTSSMGRLTLNVLLSFAQFEREVTGERIRDKIAASKQKGMWMGGYAPIGYRGNGRVLEIDVASAVLIRHIYERYQILGCVRHLKDELDASGIVTPARTTLAGRSLGSQRFSRGQLYRILSHPVYRGLIAHRDQVYPGQHQAIIEQTLWDAVQMKLAENRQGYQQRRSVPSASLLAGLVVDAQERRLIPSHSQKQSKRYRYYVSQALITASRDQAPEGLRIPAQELESVVIDALCQWLNDAQAILEALAQPDPEAIQNILAQARRLAEVLEGESEPGERQGIIGRLIRQVRVDTEAVHLSIDADALRAHDAEERNTDQPTTMLSVPVQMRRCGLAMRLLVQGPQQEAQREPDARLIRVLAKAQDWLLQLTSGQIQGVGEIAAAEGITNSYVTRMIYRACLAPDIVRAILTGTQPPDLTLETLKQHLPLPLDWNEQRRLLGFTPT